MIRALSDAIGRGERAVLRALVVVLPLMILVNVAGRALKMPIFWLDELAVLTMVWLAMLGLSVTLQTREAVAVTLLTDLVPEGARKALRCAADLVVLGFAVALLVLCWLWFDPLALWRSGFDVEAFAAGSFNYVYQEPTATLGVAKFWFWLILPLVALTSSIHALANLLDSLRAPPRTLSADAAQATAGSGE